MEIASAEQTRGAILDQHRLLGKALEQIEALALEHLTGKSDDTKRLGDALERLLGRLAKHMAFEEDQLVPILREIDAWGPERVELFQQEHIRQRRILDSLIDRARSADPIELPLLVLGFVRLLQLDIVEEEDSFLSADLLRDDVISLPEPE